MRNFIHRIAHVNCRRIIAKGEHNTHIAYMGVAGVTHLDTWYGRLALICCVLMVIATLFPSEEH